MFKTIHTTLCTVELIHVPTHKFTVVQCFPYLGSAKKTEAEAEKRAGVGYRALSVTEVETRSELRKISTADFLSIAKPIEKYTPSLVCRNIKQWLCDVEILDLTTHEFTTISGVPFGRNDKATLKKVEATLPPTKRALQCENIRCFEGLFGAEFADFMKLSEVVDKAEAAEAAEAEANEEAEAEAK